ncbi:hypothetical protein NC653_025717 [Populus alba x Populus x berolinensis]|uniref:Uncharacterized protein n=1 Tax=Populus alba x Populus x berolinensis TaxID=444605 RepID=A0AAD6MBW7_9ROSI|nr:hypothetical protein NC653_025717 [Populus alba x Populus x berolinensis]
MVRGILRIYTNVHVPDENLQGSALGTDPATLDSLQATRDFENLYMLNEWSN